MRLFEGSKFVHTSRISGPLKGTFYENIFFNIRQIHYAHTDSISIYQNCKSQLPFKIYSLYETDSINKGRPKPITKVFRRPLS